MLVSSAADVGSKFARNITGQAFDFHFTGDDLEDAALHFYAARIAEGVHGNLDAHADVHGDAQKVDVKQIAANGIVQPIFEDSGLVLAVEIDLKQSVVATLRAQDRVDLFGVDGERNGLTFAAIEDGRDSAARAQAARFVLAALGAGGCFHYYFFLLFLSHASSLL